MAYLLAGGRHRGAIGDAACINVSRFPQAWPGPHHRNCFTSAVLSISGMTLAAVIAERDKLVGEQAAMEICLRSEETVRESEEKLRLLLDSTAEGIYGIDLEHRCTFCNPACLRTLGYERIDE